MHARPSPLLLVALLALPALAACPSPSVPGRDLPDAPDGHPLPIRLPVGVTVDPVLGLGDDVTSLDLLEGRLPAGLFRDADGRLRGRPVRPEDRAVRLRIVQAGGPPGEVSLVLEVRRGALSVAPLEPSVAQAGLPFQAAFHALDATGTVRWRLARGALPPGLALDPATGTLAGTPTLPGLYPLLVQATDPAGTTASLATAVRVGPAPALAARAEAFEAAARDRMTPNGMVLSLWPDGRWSDHGDSGMWTGTFLAAMALKAAVTGDGAMRDRLLAGLSACREITGVPGLTCRGLEHDEWQGRTAGPGLVADGADVHDSTAPGFEGWRWKGDVSRDQWVGHFLGNGLARDLGDADARRRAAANLVPMALHLLDNGLQIRDVDGAVTKYGGMSGWRLDGGLPSPNGVNAVMVLSWLSVAARAAAGTPDGTRIAAALDDLVAVPFPGWDAFADGGEHGYLDAIDAFLYPYAGGYEQRQWFNVNITNDAFFLAVLGLPDGPVRDRLASQWRDGMWEDQGDLPLARRGRGERNPWFTWMYLAATGAQDPDAAFEALQQVADFPPPPRLAVAVRNSDDPRFPHDPGNDAWALDPLPVAERCSGTNFVWQRNPYELDCMGDVGQEYAGTDFVAPYWLGVAFGFLDPGW